MKTYLPSFFADQQKIEYWERRIFVQHGNYAGLGEQQAKLEYIRLARKSPTSGATFFEVSSGSEALLCVAEDGLLLGKRRSNARCGDFTFHPYERLISYTRTQHGLQLVVNVNAMSGKIMPDTITLPMTEATAVAAGAAISDYLTLLRSQLADPVLVAEVLYLFAL